MLAIGAMCMAVALSSCTQADDADANPPAAKVNGVAIPMSRINRVLEAMSGLGHTEPTKEIKAKVLGNLIDQELLVQKARDTELDCAPEVRETIRAATQHILAKTYLEQVLAAFPPLSAEDISTFYRQHASLFEQRRLFRYQELAVVLPSELVPQFRERAAKAKTFGEIVKWLQKRNLEFSAATVTKFAEQMTAGIAAKLATMADGQIAVITAANQASILQLIEVRDVPVTELEATPIIRQLLTQRRRVELVEAEIERLRHQANIEYLGQFAGELASPTVQPETENALKSVSQSKCKPTDQSSALDMF